MALWPHTFDRCDWFGTFAHCLISKCAVVIAASQFYRCAIGQLDYCAIDLIGFSVCRCIASFIRVVIACSTLQPSCFGTRLGNCAQIFNITHRFTCVGYFFDHYVDGRNAVVAGSTWLAGKMARYCRVFTLVFLQY